MSGGAIAKVTDATGHVANQAEQDVHGRALNVAAGFPAGDRVGAEAEEAGEVGLGEVEAVADGADLVG